MSDLQFTVPEILSLLGLTQCVYILVYMIFRSGHISRGTVPALYFSILGGAFLLDAAYRFWAPSIEFYTHIQWWLWFSGPLVGILLIVQIARITKAPGWRNYSVFLVLPIAYAGAYALSTFVSNCDAFVSCPATAQWLNLSGLIAGASGLLIVFLLRDLFTDLPIQKTGRERFWLIMTLISVHAAVLGVVLMIVTGVLSAEEGTIIRTLLSIGLAYLAMTSLFRIYPYAVSIRSAENAEDMTLTDAETELVLKIERLLNREKVYQESGYGRQNLAQELNISETQLSKIVNIHFGKSLPQLLNEKRVEDAKILLRDTEESVRAIAEESGFNSTATFNRVFKELEGVSPSDYRESGVR